MAAARYLALNPVEAGIAKNAFDWPWSSARAHAGLERPMIPLAENDLKTAFASRTDWRHEYATALEAPRS